MTPEMAAAERIRRTRTKDRIRATIPFALLAPLALLSAVVGAAPPQPPPGTPDYSIQAIRYGTAR
jgi:hypothetical protein